jgi:hypothetical protein
MRYQQFASHAYCGATGLVSKMASQQEKVFCALRFEVSRAMITMQREFRARFKEDAPRKNNVLWSAVTHVGLPFWTRALALPVLISYRYAPRHFLSVVCMYVCLYICMHVIPTSA